MAKNRSDRFSLLDFSIGALLAGCLGGLAGSPIAALVSAGVVVLASLILAARTLHGAVLRPYRYPLRDTRGRFVSRATLRKQHENRKGLARTVVQQPSPYSSP